MAHASTIHDLVSGLIRSITNDDASKAQINHVNKRLKEHNFARTNQFAVQAKIDGLIEKFDVLGREDLSAELQQRLVKLSAKDRFLPDRLAFLLELSDLPHLRVSPEQIKALKDTEIDTTPDWAAIIKADPPEGDIWDNIERGYHSSGDEDASSVDIKSVQTSASSVSEDIETLARLSVVQPEVVQVDLKHDFTELKLIREVLFMLRGLPTEIFVVDHRNGSVYSSTVAAIPGTTNASTQDIVNRCAETGSALNYLRGWSRAPLSAAHIRACQAAIHRLLTRFDQEVSDMEAQFVHPNRDVVVSILQVCDQVEQWSHSLVCLSKTIRKAMHQESRTPVSILNELYLAACEAQAIFDDACLTLIDVLTAGCSVYLRPIQDWISTGSYEIQEPHPLVAANETCAMSSIWYDRVSLRDEDGILPVFLEDFKDMLFAAGKERMMLGYLDQLLSTTAGRPALTFGSADMLLPFSQHFQEVLSDHFDHYRLSDSTLTRTLLDDYHLIRHFDQLEAMFLLKDACFITDFGTAIFEKLRGAGHHRWLDSFLLTELARDSLGENRDIDSKSLTVVAPNIQQDSGILHPLGQIRVRYTVPWYMANIIDAESSSVHENILALLLQLLYCKNLLQRAILASRQHSLGRLTSDEGRQACLVHCLITFLGTMTVHTTSAGAQYHKILRVNLGSATTFDAMILAYTSFAHRLSIATFTHTSMSFTHDLLISVMALSEEVVRVRSHSGKEYSSAINTAWQTYDRRMRRLIGAVTASTELDIDTIDALTAALYACLPPGG